MKALTTTLLFLFFLFGVFGQAPLVKQWDFRYGGTDIEEIPLMQQTIDGGFILGAGSNSLMSGDKTEANWDTVPQYSHDYWVIKLDSSGTKQWDKRYGGSNDDKLYALQQTADG